MQTPKALNKKTLHPLHPLAALARYTEICADIRLEAEKFGAVVSIEAIVYGQVTIRTRAIRVCAGIVCMYIYIYIHI